jgi:2,5-dihydroxypyridine 5,6-dioxygenase
MFLDDAAMRRLFPSQELIERTLAGKQRLDEAKTIRVTSRAGTDLTLSKRSRGASARTGVVREPGARDKFGFAMVSTVPLEDSAEGTLVFNRGDSLGFLLGALNNFCPDPVRLDFRGGEIVKIEGKVAAQALRRRLEEINRPEFYRIAHIGWGTHDRAVWGGTDFTAADWESLHGALIVHCGALTLDSFPMDLWPIPQHIGGTLLSHDLYLDDELIIKEGQIVADGL